MKNVFKKISAALIAISLLSTGLAATKTSISKINYTLTAHAEYAHNCSSYKHVIDQTPWKCQESINMGGGLRKRCYYTRLTTYKCAVCGKEWVECDFDTKEMWIWEKP